MQVSLTNYPLSNGIFVIKCQPLLPQLSPATPTRSICLPYHRHRHFCETRGPWLAMCRLPHISLVKQLARRSIISVVASHGINPSTLRTKMRKSDIMPQQMSDMQIHQGLPRYNPSHMAVMSNMTVYLDGFISAVLAYINFYLYNQIIGLLTTSGFFWHASCC